MPVFFELAKQINLVKEESLEKAQELAALMKYLGSVIGILQQEPEAFLQGDNDDVAEIEALIATRNQARADKNWALADEARDKLTAMGIVLEDGAGGTSWRRS